MIDLANLEGTEVVWDLGAGDSRFLIEVKRRCPTVTARGCEIVPTIWLLGKFCIWWSGSEVDLKLGSVEHADVADADVIFLYLIPVLMKRLERKFDRELKPGTQVFSHAFQFPGKEPARIEEVMGKKIYVYRW